MRHSAKKGPSSASLGWSLAFLIVISAVAGARARLPQALEAEPELAPMQRAALTLDGGVDWINTDRPIHLDKLRGKIVLLDFWTYCCINCHHVLPDLARLEEKYKNQLVVIGVHTAKFPAERITANIRKKVAEYKIKHPVVNDANQVIWNRFGVNSWPTVVLIDANGEYMGHASGEGHGEALDRVIGDLVTKHKAKGELDETPIEFPAESGKVHNGGLLYPGKITADAKGNRLYISDTGHNRIVVTDLSGKLIETVGNGQTGLTDGDYQQATFERPQGSCLVDQTLFVADTENHAIRAVDLKAKTVKTVAGTGRQSYNRNISGPGREVGLNSPWDLIPIPGTKTLAVAMAGPHQIWTYDYEKGVVGSWLGSGIENIVDGGPSSAAFAQPSGLATDGKSLFVADSEVSGLRSVDLANKSHRIHTIVGVGLFGFGDKDGKGSSVRLQHCLGLAYGDGKLYVADTYNNKIKVCNPATKTVKTFAGSGKPGLKDEPAQFDEPGGLSLADKLLFVADTNNHAIRTIEVESGKVGTLDISSVKPPTVKKQPTFSNATVSTHPGIKLSAGEAFDLNVSLELPPGYKLSADAPLVYKVEAPGSDGTLVGPGAQLAAEIETPSNPFKLPLRFAKARGLGEKVDLKISLSAFVCLPNTLCTIKNYVVTVPVTFADGGENKASVKISAAK
jgi:thiol-disulfide isomerase/thioredoxin